MTRQPSTGARIRNAPGRPRRRRRLRWAVAGLAVLAVLAVAAIALFISQTSPPPLTLPAGAPAAPSGPASGTWQVSPGSVAGFRIQETALGFSNDVVGRTSRVTGTIVISGDQVTGATLRICLAAIKVGGKTEPQLAKSLRTRQFPSATFTLTRPVNLGPAFIAGKIITVTAAGVLDLRGTEHAVTVRISARRDGQALQAAGSIPVSFADWGIKGPGGPGFLGSLAHHGVAEFLLTLHRS